MNYHNLNFLTIDYMDWHSDLSPQWILGKEELLPVFIGVNHYADKYDNCVGIYILNEDYEKIDHNLFYVFFHDIYLSEEDLNTLLEKNPHVFAECGEKDISEEAPEIRSHFHFY